MILKEVPAGLAQQANKQSLLDSIFQQAFLVLSVLILQFKKSVV